VQRTIPGGNHSVKAFHALLYSLFYIWILWRGSRLLLKGRQQAAAARQRRQYALILRRSRQSTLARPLKSRSIHKHILTRWSRHWIPPSHPFLSPPSLPHRPSLSSSLVSPPAPKSSALRLPDDPPLPASLTHLLDQSLKNSRTSTRARASRASRCSSWTRPNLNRTLFPSLS
jgi:hypothetical protein